MRWLKLGGTRGVPGGADSPAPTSAAGATGQGGADMLTAQKTPSADAAGTGHAATGHAGTEPAIPTWKLFLAAIGPGMVSAMAGNDAGGIATYSSAGASYGYNILWMILIMTLMLVVVQESAARMGSVTGKGFSSLIRERFGIRLTALAMLALFVSNVAVTLSQFAGIAAGMALFGIPAYVSVPLSGLLVWMLCSSGSYKRIEKILLAISCIFVTYVVAAFIAGPNWGSALYHTVVPAFNGDAKFFSLLIATIGTTIAPWMIFLTQNNVVDRGEGVEKLKFQRADVVSGSVCACAIAWFIIVTTGTVLFPNGIAVESAEDAARALAPIAGAYAEKLFAAGLVAASFLAACVLPGVTASALCEAFGWERGADRGWDEAPAYNGLITGILVFSCAIVLIPGVNLFGIMTTSQVICGVLLPVLLVFLVLLSSDRHIMGEYANSKLWNILTWSTVVLVAVLTVIMFGMELLGI